MSNKPQPLNIDLSTRRIQARDGAEVDEWRIETVRKASKAYGRAWGLVFLDTARLLARVRMRPAEASVLWWAIGNLHPKDWTLARHDQIAAEIGLTRSAVTKALQGLEARGLVQVGRGSLLRLSLFLTWQGTAQAYQKARRGRSQEIEAGRQWHRAHAEGEAPSSKMWRIAGDGEDATQPRERGAGAPRGGDARSIADIVARIGLRPDDAEGGAGE